MQYNVMSLVCFLGLSLMIVQGGLGQSTETVTKGSPFNCVRYNKTINVIRGWPHKFEATDYTHYLLIGASYLDETQFLVINGVNGSVLYNTTVLIYSIFSKAYFTSDLYPGSLLRYKIVAMVAKKEKCEEHDITLQVVDDVETCADTVHADNVRSITAVPGMTTNLRCNSEQTVAHKVSLDPSKHNYTVQWLYNCSPQLPNNTQQSPIRNNFGQLSIVNAKTDNVGTYTCIVTYDGKSRFVRSYDVCMNAPDAKAEGIVTCQQETYLIPNLGANLTVSCSLSVGIGRIADAMIATFWNKTKGNDFECVNTQPGFYHPAEDDNSRHSCIRTLEQPDPTCFRTPPTLNDLKAEESHVIATLQLVDIEQQDLGLYTVVYESSKGKKIFHNVTIAIDQAPTAIAQATVIAAAITAACFVLLLVGLAYFFRFYLAVYWKTRFAKYDVDDKDFGAFFSYHFYKEIDTFGKIQARDTCEGVREQMEKLGLSLYDERRNGIAGFKAENYINMMRRCHRVVIILTPEYVKDHWSVFQLHESFLAMIESGSKIVFVLVPGMKEHIKKQAATDDTYRMIQRAIKLNSASVWPGRTFCCGNKFEMEMRLAMPKLQEREDGRKRRSSSDSEFGMHPTGVERILSNMTTTTEIGPDDIDMTSR
uniref:Soluble interferon alpha/beta receptor OPG204 n=1 Tax=Phallusia mammillata TaxID=59560 RepID=A0A6F9DFR0_9ASCI|nr:uncharacterized protein LOC100175496 [Phallusia mammillata]